MISSSVKTTVSFVESDALRWHSADADCLINIIRTLLEKSIEQDTPIFDNRVWAKTDSMDLTNRLPWLSADYVHAMINKMGKTGYLIKHHLKKTCDPHNNKLYLSLNEPRFIISETKIFQPEDV